MHFKMVALKFVYFYSHITCIDYRTTNYRLMSLGRNNDTNSISSDMKQYGQNSASKIYLVTNSTGLQKLQKKKLLEHDKLYNQKLKKKIYFFMDRTHMTKCFILFSEKDKVTHLPLFRD